ncbi:MAG: hypothetical protein ACR2QC_08610 [Gammaproteobacteria bacterium]
MSRISRIVPAFPPPDNPRAKNSVSAFTRVPFRPPSHSCEGRNLRRRKAAGNCKRLRRQLPPSAMRFLPSQEWN